MPYQTIPATNVTYALIAFDKKGLERTDDHDGISGSMSNRILKDAVATQPTHVFFFSHGWKGDVPAAIDQYNRWIKAMTDRVADREQMGSAFRPLWIGLHWPSLPFGDEEFGGNSFEAQQISPDLLLEEYLERFGNDSLEVRHALETIFAENQRNAGALTLPENVARAYQDLATAIGRTVSEGLGGAPDTDAAPFDAQLAFEAGNESSASFGGGGALDGLLGPLRQLSFWKMKNRARTVGEGGMHSFIAQLQQVLPDTKFHLMGHSFGCIVVSSILGGPGGNTALPRQIDSVVLVQGALSLWGYADPVPSEYGGGLGYFSRTIARPAVRGPIVTTRSIHDTAVGTIYPLAVGLVGQVDFAVTLPKFGGIGAFGIQGRTGTTNQKMKNETEVYNFTPGSITNLESSEFIKKMDGVSGAHSDIDGPQVAHAIWQAALV
jgi:hypothetical protein